MNLLKRFKLCLSRNLCEDKSIKAQQMYFLNNIEKYNATSTQYQTWLYEIHLSKLKYEEKKNP